jgi:hypothetical protein
MTDSLAAEPMLHIAASQVISAPPVVVFAFLAEPANHRLLAGRRVQLLELLDGSDGRIRGLVVIRGPLGLRRRARTRVISSSRPAFLAGAAQLGTHTIVQVRWDLQPFDSNRTRVLLSAGVTSVGSLDRLLLLAGGTAWIRHLFASTLELLADQVGRAQVQDRAADEAPTRSSSGWPAASAPTHTVSGVQ